MNLIDRDKLKQYIDDCKCCEKCDKIGFMCNDDCELPDVLTPQWERVLNEQPTVDAIPVSWLTNLAKEYEESDNQFFRMDSCVIEDLIKSWKEGQENND